MRRDAALRGLEKLLHRGDFGATELIPVELEVNLLSPTLSKITQKLHRLSENFVAFSSTVPEEYCTSNLHRFASFK